VTSRGGLPLSTLLEPVRQGSFTLTPTFGRSAR
jgi:hypothetical protein